MTDDITQPSQEYQAKFAALGLTKKNPYQGPGVNLVKTKDGIIDAIKNDGRISVCYTCPGNYADGRKIEVSYFAGFNPTSDEPVFVVMVPPVFPYGKTTPGPQCPDCAKIDETDFAMGHRSLEKLAQK